MDVHNTVFTKEASPSEFIQGLRSAFNAFKGAEPVGKGVLARIGERIDAAKGGFAAESAPGTSTYEAAKYLYNLPGRMFGDTFSGKLGYGGGARWLGRQLGADGKWTVNPATGRTKWHYTGPKPGAPESFRKDIANWLAENGTASEAAVARAKMKGNEAARALQRNGHNVLGGVLRHTGGPLTGVALTVSGPLATSMAFGPDSTAANLSMAKARLAYLPAEFLNPVGLAIHAGLYGAGKIGDHFASQAVDAAQSASRATADAIAQRMQDQGRLAFLYGAISPEAYAAKLRQAARSETDAFFDNLRKNI